MDLSQNWKSTVTEVKNMKLRLNEAIKITSNACA